MLAMTLQEKKQPLVPSDREKFTPQPGQVIVDLQAAALNRRDFWITQGMYPGIRLPVVLGSDGAGVVTAVGAEADESWLNQNVIINPGLNWGDDPRVQSPEFEILGMPGDGTFAEQICIPASAVHHVPEHLDVRSAAALPLAGVTAYRAVLTQGGLQPGETVLISGVGGGVATFALQYALAQGAKVAVTSSSEQKLAKAKELGAEAGYLYTDEDWHKSFRSDFGDADLIIDSAGGDGYARLVEVAAFGGRIVSYGSTAGPPAELNMFQVFWKQLRLQGSTMGSPSDFSNMLGFLTKHEISPVIDREFSLSEVNAALAEMKSSSQFGKLVLLI